MYLRLFLAAVITVSSVVPAGAASPSRGIPSSLPQTRALDNDLSRLSAQARQTINVLLQVRKDLGAARRDVDRAKGVVKKLRDLDNRIKRLISNLQPYRSIPTVRNVANTASRNLKKLQQKIQPVRRKADQFERNVLNPLRQKLVTAESKVNKAQSKVRQAQAAVDSSRGQLAQTASLAQQNRTTAQGLESASRTLRPSVTRLTSALAKVNSQATNVRSKVQAVRSALAAFNSVEGSLNETARLMRPLANITTDIDRVLSKKLTIRIPIPPFKKVSFSVRKILTKPGQILDIVLKPLEKLVSKLLDPIMKKAGLEIPAPKGLAKLNSSMSKLSSLTGSLDASLRQLESTLEREVTRQADQLTNQLRQQLAGVTRRQQTQRHSAVIWSR